jgi:prephenate dehydratase
MNNRASIAYLGPKGSFSSVAAAKFRRDASTLPCPNLEEVFKAVDSGEVQYGCVAIENNVAGSVGETLDLLKAFESVTIIDALWLPVHFNAYALPDAEPKNIRVVRAHPVALAQCNNFVTKHNLAPLAALSNALAVQELDENSVALAPVESPEFANYSIFERNVQDYEKACTQFVLIKKASDLEKFKDRLAYVIVPNSNGSGVLAKILNEFAINNINLTSLISRPHKGENDMYNFFLTLEPFNNCEDAELNEIINKIVSYGNEVRFLGSYSHSNYEKEAEDD